MHARSTLAGWRLGALAIATASLASCVVVTRRPSRSETTMSPPAPAHEPPALCTPGYARVPGHWRWNGYQYAWVPQRCVYRPGFRWEAGGYYPCGDGYCYREGAWVEGAVRVGP